MTDWTVQSRVKVYHYWHVFGYTSKTFVWLCLQSSQLLFTLLYHMEDHVTHHIQPVINGLYRACQDDEPLVVTQVPYLFTSITMATADLFCSPPSAVSQVCRAHWVLCFTRGMVQVGVASRKDQCRLSCDWDWPIQYSRCGAGPVYQLPTSVRWPYQRSQARYSEAIHEGRQHTHGGNVCSLYRKCLQLSLVSEITKLITCINASTLLNVCVIGWSLWLETRTWWGCYIWVCFMMVVQSIYHGWCSVVGKI